MLLTLKYFILVVVLFYHFMSISLHISPSCFIREQQRHCVVHFRTSLDNVCMCVLWCVIYIFTFLYYFLDRGIRTRFNLKRTKMLPAENPENVHMHGCLCALSWLTFPYSMTDLRRLKVERAFFGQDWMRHSFVSIVKDWETVEFNDGLSSLLGWKIHLRKWIFLNTHCTASSVANKFYNK